MRRLENSLKKPFFVFEIMENHAFGPICALQYSLFVPQ
jgi:hypothetical protein